MTNLSREGINDSQMICTGMTEITHNSNDPVQNAFEQSIILHIVLLLGLWSTLLNSEVRLFNYYLLGYFFTYRNFRHSISDNNLQNLKSLSYRK